MSDAAIHHQSAPVPAECRTFVTAPWTVHEYAIATSTNLLAATLPAWHAVRADTQTAGRGRFQRTWVSDHGGLWLSAVVPLPNSAPKASAPLVAGLAVCEALRSMGIERLRMRWPNDLMVHHGKLAGLLIDQFTPGLAVIGVGLNVTNQPELRDPALAGHVVRLADLLDPAPNLDSIMRGVLKHLASVWADWETLGSDALLPRLNGLWATPIPVELDLDGHRVRGDFQGIDSAGRLLLRSQDGQTNLYEPHHVRLLRELS